MIDLEHLDALDDDAPPSPDLRQVHRRAGRLRTRNRLAAIGAGVAVLAVAVGVFAVVRDGDHSVEVVGPPATTGSKLGVHLEVPQSTYPSGYSMEGTIVFENASGAPIDYTLDCFQTPPWKVVLSKDGVLFELPQTTPACTGPGTIKHLAPGATRVPFYLALVYAGCGNTREPTLASPRCVDGGIPDLAPGTYQIVFKGKGAPFQSLEVAPVPITVATR